MGKVVITDHVFPSIDLERKILASAGIELEEAKPSCKTGEDVIQRCQDADALLVQWAPITRHVLASLAQVKFVVRYGIGVDNIDLKGAKDLGIRVANVPNYCVEEVSDHAMAMMLSLARRIPQDHHQIAQGGWGIQPFLPIPALYSLTLGLVGFGSIARRVAQKAKAFCVHIIAFDPFVSASTFSDLAVECVDRDGLFCSADIISLHCPLVPETTHIIRRETIEMMKPGVLLINTARGPLVKQEDLVGALRSGKIVGAGLDVFEREPLPPDSPLRAFSNVILTSHAAAVSERAGAMLQTKAAEAVLDFMQGRQPKATLV